MIVDDFGNVVDKHGKRPRVAVEFEIEKRCKTCCLADDLGRSKCFVCGGWHPKPHLVPKDWFRKPGPTVMYFKEET